MTTSSSIASRWSTLSASSGVFGCLNIPLPTLQPRLLHQLSYTLYDSDNIQFGQILNPDLAQTIHTIMFTTFCSHNDLGCKVKILYQSFGVGPRKWFQPNTCPQKPRLLIHHFLWLSPHQQGCNRF